MNRIACFSSIGLLLVLVGASPAFTDHCGIQDGWAVHNDGTILLTPTVAATMRASGAEWVRLHFRLAGHSTWDDTILSKYDEVVANVKAQGLNIMGLFNGESWTRGGGQAAWTANNAECNSVRDGDNKYIQDLMENAIIRLATRYQNDIQYWEIWNEPNAWTVTNPASCQAGVWIGGFYIYPSNFAWLLKRVYEGFKANNLPNAKVVSGGLLAADFTGTCPDSGSDYLTATYTMGINKAAWEMTRSTYGSYPLDHVGIHTYISQCCVMTSKEYKFYLDCLHDAYTAFEGANTPKQIWNTEFGWPTNPGGMSEADQAANLETAYGVIKTTRYMGPGFWFTLHDNPFAGLFYGLRRADDTPKESWSAYQQTCQDR